MRAGPILSLILLVQSVLAGTAHARATSMWRDFAPTSAITIDEIAWIDDWDLLVLMSGHDGASNADDWGGVRWVNADVSEWQFGGGANGIAGREPDPNIVDLLAVPGRQLNRRRSSSSRSTTSRQKPGLAS